MYGRRAISKLMDAISAPNLAWPFERRVSKWSSLPPPALYLLLATVVAAGLGIFTLAGTFVASNPKVCRLVEDDYGLKMQVLYICLGLVAMLAVSRMNYAFVLRYRYLTYSAAVVLLFVSHIPAYGHQGYLAIGRCYIDAAAIAVLSLIALTAGEADLSRLKRAIDGQTTYRNDRKQQVMFVITHVFVIVPFYRTLGPSACFALVFSTIAVLRAARVPKEQWKTVLLALTATLAVLMLVHSGTHGIERLQNWIGYQASGLENPSARNAFYSAKTISFNYGCLDLLKCSSDAPGAYAFASMAEQFGRLGAVIFLVPLVMVMACAVWIRITSKFTGGELLAVGLSTYLASQVLIHVCVNMGLLPVMGCSLPYFSYGPNMTFFTMLSTGILINVARQHA